MESDMVCLSSRVRLEGWEFLNDSRDDLNEVSVTSGRDFSLISVRDRSTVMTIAYICISIMIDHVQIMRTYNCGRSGVCIASRFELSTIITTESRVHASAQLRTEDTLPSISIGKSNLRGPTDGMLKQEASRYIFALSTLEIDDLIRTHSHKADTVSSRDVCTPGLNHTVEIQHRMCERLRDTFISKRTEFTDDSRNRYRFKVGLLEGDGIVLSRVDVLYHNA
ncbi:hypothetical protein Tco_0333467 [Tanacetum coccineum]